jgi:purine nucleosidase
LARTQPLHVDVEYTSELTHGKSVIGYVGDLSQPPAEHDQFGFDSSGWPHAWRQRFRHQPNVRAVVAFDTPRFINLFVERAEQLARLRRM